MPLDRNCRVNTTETFMPVDKLGNNQPAHSHTDIQVVLFDDHIRKNLS